MNNKLQANLIQKALARRGVKTPDTEEGIVSYHGKAPEGSSGGPGVYVQQITDEGEVWVCLGSTYETALSEAVGGKIAGGVIGTRGDGVTEASTAATIARVATVFLGPAALATGLEVAKATRHRGKAQVAEGLMGLIGGTAAIKAKNPDARVVGGMTAAVAASGAARDHIAPMVMDFFDIERADQDHDYEMEEGHYEDDEYEDDVLGELDAALEAEDEAEQVQSAQAPIVQTPVAQTAVAQPVVAEDPLVAAIRGMSAGDRKALVDLIAEQPVNQPQPAQAPQPAQQAQPAQTATLHIATDGQQEQRAEAG